MKLFNKTLCLILLIPFRNTILFFFLKGLQFILIIILSEAAYCQKAWNPLQGGLEGICYSLFNDSNSGKLLIGGWFEYQNARRVDNVLSWDGKSLQNVGNGTYMMSISDFERFNDTLFAVGMSEPIIPSFRHLAKFDESDSLWKSIPNWKGAGLYGQALVKFQNELIVIGNYGWVPSSDKVIVSYDGANFKKLLTNYDDITGIMLGGQVFDSNFYLHGNFDTLESQKILNIGKWNGSVWDSCALNDIPTTQVQSMGVYRDTLYAGTVEGNLYKLSFNMWVLLASADGAILEMKEFDDKLYIGGAFENIGGKLCNYICYYDGSEFNAIDLGTNGSVGSIEMYGGDLFIGGSFTQAGGKQVNYVARWGLPTGIAPLNSSGSGFKFFPNPSSGLVNLVSINANIGGVWIYDVTGKIILHQSNVNRDKTSIVFPESCKDGLYFIQVMSGEKTVGKKILLHRP